MCGTSERAICGACREWRVGWRRSCRDEVEFGAGGEHGVLVDEAAVAVAGANEGDA